MSNSQSRFEWKSWPKRRPNSKNKKPYPDTYDALEIKIIHTVVDHYISYGEGMSVDEIRSELMISYAHTQRVIHDRMNTPGSWMALAICSSNEQSFPTQKHVWEPTEDFLNERVRQQFDYFQGEGEHHDQPEGDEE